MEAKKYSSYAEIDRDLEILKLQKEINYHKLVLSFEKTKENIRVENILHEYFSSFKKYISHSYPKILQAILPFIINWFINKKRGN